MPQKFFPLKRLKLDKIDLTVYIKFYFSSVDPRGKGFTMQKKDKPNLFGSSLTSYDNKTVSICRQLLQIFWFLLPVSHPFT